MTFPTTDSIDPDIQRRGQRLRLTLRLAVWWLLAQGAMQVLMGEWLATKLNLRYDYVMVPYLRAGGLALLSLGLFLNAGVRSPRYQVLAVDVLLLFLLGKVFFALNFKLERNALTWFEWFGLALDLGLATGLTLWRTRARDMDPESAGTLLALSVQEWSSQWKDWQGRNRPKRRALGGLDGEKAQSESLPHMD